ncbi:shikimate kinase [Labrys monachus]|uniref:Shikimate kinase n=1 Tax=Labrys monachus TaxID=217067 RepID=A0ABU0F828_9HYPH|nr:shikimate kinase [Labrys monachus]MDQ0390740.1 shikimate kinase [Labrys monachus]
MTLLMQDEMGEAATSLAPAERERKLAAALAGRSIVLVGMMGAGKSAVGKRLAMRLGLDFRDADTEIEEAAQKSIPEIFASDGEAFFRDKERRVIARLLACDRPIVLATGGGAYMNEETRALIAERGISIWLKAELDVLMRRVRRKPTRPLLQTADPEATLRKLIELRYPTYAHADVTVLSRDVAHDSVLEEVVGALEAHLLKAKPDATP